MKSNVKEVIVDGKTVRLTNLDKLMWPDDGITKAELIKYYADMADVLLPYLRDRLFVMSRYPDGVDGQMFYQKDCPDYGPEWLTIFPVDSPDVKKTVNYIVCNERAALLWLANQACIELHIWLAKIPRINYPDIAVFDLDPFEPAAFTDTLEIALMVKEALSQFGLEGYPKTSGATGLHIFVPIIPEYTYQEVRNAVEFICRQIHSVFPQKTTLERLITDRTGKVYLDYLQNTRGKTMTFQYSLRPLPGAPVSTPLTWDEIKTGRVLPNDFRIDNISDRLADVGDLYTDLLNSRQSLKNLVNLASDKFLPSKQENKNLPRKRLKTVRV
ncbi:MAG: DNA polymerase domain-containing protein [Firmicutes bacterium HGW-Firmicutes-8]|nr:MAG: DNA polymerase domain-containing protein [Firmicutes bacterium HGW-Firmicutes-8]